MNAGTVPLKIAIAGVSGRMGQMLVKTVVASGKARLVGCVERAGNPWLGRDIGEVRDAAHVTEFADAHLLVDAHVGGDLLVVLQR